MSRQISPYSLKGLVKRALKAARMEDASFDVLFPTDSLPTDEKEVTEFIKRRTELYRQSWIIKPLEMAVEKMEKKKREGDL